MNVLEKIVNQQNSKLIYLNQKYKIRKKIKCKSRFIKEIEKNNSQNKTSLIAEFKRFSPSVKEFKKVQSIREVIKSYDKANVTCISILTDKNFGGSINDIVIAKKYTNKPIIRKDFIVDPIQIYESDAILLIARILTEKKLLELENCARSYGLDVLIEIESEKDLLKIKRTKTNLIGINNRNLALQKIDIKKTLELSSKIKNRIIVSESGLTLRNISVIKKNKINTFLIGGSILNNKDIKKYIAEISK